MSKKRSRSNLTKRHAALSRALLKQMQAVVVWVCGQNDNAIQLINLRNGNSYRVTPKIVHAVADVAHDWTIYCAALGRRQDGQEYMQSKLVIADQCYQSDISDQLNAIHIDILKQMNPKHRAGLAWIACPWGEDIPEDAAGALLEKMDAWCLESADIELRA